ncbi:MAG: penicillin acylase family protein [Acidobacteriota bacterium]|nr:penicillin acylase family protein [Acidobacteriota bacterium]
MNWRLLFRGLAVLLVLLVLVAAGAWYWFTHSGEPRRSGEAALAGLDAPVTVRWDRWGMPHVTADSATDAVMALGYLHANDRMAQLELGRRAASGRISQILGEGALDFDRRMRLLQLRRTAERLWEHAGPESRALLEAYAAGVNAWLEERGGDLPPTLRLLRITPEPWTPVDSFCFALMMAEDLSFWNDRPEEERFIWLQRFGLERTLELVGDDVQPPAESILALAASDSPSEVRPSEVRPAEARPSESAPAEGETLEENGSEEAAAEEIAALRRGGGGVGALAPGSNNWAVGVSRTATGAPLVANDPHLGLALPGTWYQVALHAPDYRVSGFSLPGLPVVVIGRTEQLAWAVTNVMLDDHDIFIEELSEDGTQVRRSDGWLDIDLQTEQIPLPDGSTVELEIRTTDLGPLLKALPQYDIPARSLAWTAHLPQDPLAALLALARAKTVDEVPAAIASYVAPAQNLVVADRQGGLLYTVLGQVPQRRSGDGRMAAPAWDPAYGWDGLRPAEEDPRVLRPEDDLLVTANTDVRPQGYERLFSADFDTPHRRDRIRELLGDRRDWQPASFADLQEDVLSRYALEVVAKLDGGYEGDAQRAYETLQAWDGSMELTGPSALFALFEHELALAVWDDEEDHLRSPDLYSRDRMGRLLAGELDSAWFDDVTTEEVETRRQIISSALASAWSAGQERWGQAVADWRYGDLHQLLLAHPAGSAPVVGSLFNRGPFPLPGSATTVAAFGGGWRGGVAPVTYGPSMRWVADLEDPNRDLAVLPGGQSGHPWNDHYDDQLDLYLAGETRTVPWTDEAVEAATVSRLELVPAD